MKFVPQSVGKLRPSFPQPALPRSSNPSFSGPSTNTKTLSQASPTSFLSSVLLLDTPSYTSTTHSLESPSRAPGDLFTMATEIAGAHTNGTMEDAGSATRSIKDHMLFEISTEVANRGKLLSVHQISWVEGLREHSRWDLLCHQVESTSHYCRIWRPLYAYWASQSGIGELSVEDLSPEALTFM